MGVPTRQQIAGITYRESGPHDASVPVICLHGIGGDDTSFADQLTGLGARRVIAWNMPGYAGSTPLPEMDFAALANALIGFMDALGIAKAHVVGQSIGGMIAQEVALRAPERVASLGLIATVSAFGGRDDSFKEAFLQVRLAPLDKGVSMTEMATEAITSIIGPDATNTMRTAAITAMAAINPDAYRQVLACLVTFNRREDQHRITVPCCLIAGALDSNSPVRAMEKMAAGLPHAALHIIDRAGHLVNSEKPDEVNKIFTAFFDRL